jgi:hypothetical protein
MPTEATLESRIRADPLAEIARFAKFAGFAKLIVDAPVRLGFAFNKIAMEYGLLFKNWNQAEKGSNDELQNRPRR